MPESTSHPTLPTLSYRSKVDVWLAAIAIGALFALLSSMAAALLEEPSPSWPPVLIALLVIAIVVMGSVPVRYILDRSELIIQSGFLRYHIPYDRIRSVRPSRTLLAAPAWSLDRLLIDHIGSGMGVSVGSPAERDQFLDHLADRAGLVRSGDRLTRS